MLDERELAPTDHTAASHMAAGHTVASHTAAARTAVDGTADRTPADPTPTNRTPADRTAADLTAEPSIDVTVDHIGHDLARLIRIVARMRQHTDMAVAHVLGLLI